MAVKPGDVRRVNRRWARVRVPKVGWVRFRWSRAVPDAKSYRVTRDRAGRWHVAFAVTPAPGTRAVVGVDRGVVVSAALSTGELEPAVFRCVACGHTANADVNAARNIAVGNIAAGRAVTARGGTALAVPANRESQHRAPLPTGA